MHVLFVHRAGSGQFAALIASLVAQGDEVTLITERPAQEQPGVSQLVYSVEETSTRHAALAATEYHLRTGEAVAGLMERLNTAIRPMSSSDISAGAGCCSPATRCRMRR